MDPLGAEGFRAAAGVSRETSERLAAYVDLLGQWNRRVNLVGRATMADVWRRHVLDSAQLFPQLPPDARTVVDLGSGAGFPGLVLAILGVPDMHLVEADGRKAVFLREAARVAAARVTVHAGRIEDMPGLAADAVTGRALADLPRLLDLAEKFVTSRTICLFLKGRNAAQELTEARKTWKMRDTLLPSLSDPEGSILRLESVVRADRSCAS